MDQVRWSGGASVWWRWRINLSADMPREVEGPDTIPVGTPGDGSSLETAAPPGAHRGGARAAGKRGGAERSSPGRAERRARLNGGSLGSQELALETVVSL